ncbi:uncharacterized protein LOC119913201 [Micropterus salmoides]|uniref:uncharacterized protein LOC119913201 n=1 Tax=Micropterus salmoides TaxID=27706 RepID=UPI0018ED3194|nr:uncharacterized protein LOC119913201 [Micropterus salmoides]
MSSTEDQNEDSLNQSKSRSSPKFLGLSRCAACYNRQASSTHWHGGDGESSSSAEDSGPEVDRESEAESSSSSSSSSCCSGEDLSEILEPGGKEGDGPEETGETSESQGDKSGTKGITRRATLVKSYSLPTSFAPHLTPLSLLPRPHKVVSTLHLQAFTQQHDDDNAFNIVIHHLAKTEKDSAQESNGGGRGGMNYLLPPQPLQWQQKAFSWQLPTLEQHQLSHQYPQTPHQLSYQHQQQQPPRFSPPSAQCQRLPPPLHTLPVLQPPTLHTPLQVPSSPQKHLHALTPQPCWCCYNMQFPYSPYWSY